MARKKNADLDSEGDTWDAPLPDVALVPEDTQPVPEAAPVAVVPELPRVGLDVFAKVSGVKPDQLAGFVRWAKRGKLGPRTVPEWKAALTDFDNRPV